jgi:hypothetical protein
LLKRFRCDVRLKMYDDEDHYLLFSQQESMLDEIDKLMTVVPPSVDYRHEPAWPKNHY